MRGMNNFTPYHVSRKNSSAPVARDLLERGGEGGRGSRGGGRGSRGEPPARTYPIQREQKNYWRTNNSAHGNVMLSAVKKGNSSLNVNLGFPHLTNTQQLQQSRTFTISRVEYLSPQGVLLPLSTVRLPHPCGLSCGIPLLGRRPPPKLCTGSPFTGCFHGRVTFAMVPGAAWPGSDQRTVIFLVIQPNPRLNRSRVAIFCATATNSHSVAIGTLKKSVAHAFCASL